MSNSIESREEIIKRAFSHVCKNKGYGKRTIRSFKLFIDRFNETLQIGLADAELKLIIKFSNSPSQEHEVVVDLDELEKLIHEPNS